MSQVPGAQGEVLGPQDLGAPQLQAGQRAPPPRLEGEVAPVGTVFTQGRARPVCPRWGHVPSPLARRSWRSVPLIKLGSSRSGPHGGSCRPPGPMDPLYFTEADSTLIPTLGVPSREVAFHFSPAEPGGAPVTLLGCR